MFKLLIAEDEALERQALRFIFERSERDISIVAEARNGWQTVELARDLKPDIVFMDVKMPGIDGLQATRAIKQLRPEAKIVVLSAHSEFSYAQEALRLGALDYVLKPAKPADLLTVLDRAIAAAESDRMDRHIRESLKEAMPFIQMSFVNDLLSGVISTAEEASGRAQVAGLPACPNLAMVIDIDHFSTWASNLSETEKAVAKNQVFRLAIEAVKNQSSCLLVPQTADKLVLVLCTGEQESYEDAKQRAVQIAQQIRQSVQGSNRLSVTIGVGRPHRHPQDFHKSYEEALRAQRHKLFLGRNRVIHVDDIERLGDNVDSYPYEQEQELCRHIKSGAKDKAVPALLDVLSRLIEGKGKQPETVRARVLELLVMASRAAIEAGALADIRQSANFRYAQELSGIDTAQELRDWLVQVVAEITEAVVKAHQLRNRRIIDRAASFIKVNCTSDLTLEQVAEEVHLSPFYFSRIFKQEQGCTFIEYLVKARIEEAKSLLRTSRMSITQISSQVGYQDSNYFSQVFRHVEGTTPSHYRRNFAGDYQSDHLP